MERRLIVARMNPEAAQSVSEIFAESDAGPLPALVGVTGRSLFHFRGLYFHLIEAEHPVDRGIEAARVDPLLDRKSVV